jgi:hypothetical protein
MSGSASTALYIEIDCHKPVFTRFAHCRGECCPANLGPMQARGFVMRAAALLLIIVAFVGVSSPSMADDCAGMPITARGEPARLQWLALLKARGNWRARVRAVPSLGADYANYGRSQAAQERCVTSAISVWCEVTATPCKP